MIRAEEEKEYYMIAEELVQNSIKMLESVLIHNSENPTNKCKHSDLDHIITNLTDAKVYIARGTP